MGTPSRTSPKRSFTIIKVPEATDTFGTAWTAYGETDAAFNGRAYRVRTDANSPKGNSMAIRHDSPGRRSIRVEREVPGTPEQVWQALATGPGISSWFYPTDVEERDGGDFCYHTGYQMDYPGRATGWEPPYRFAHEGRDCGPDGPLTLTDWTIEPRAGGRCLVRVVHSLFTVSDKWDESLLSFEAGWPQCLAILDLYLGHFGNPPASIVRTLANLDGTAHDAWIALLGVLGTEGLAPGDRWTLAAPGAADLTGVFREARPGRQPYAVFRLDGPAPGVAAASTYKTSEKATVTLSIYFYGDEAPAVVARDEAAWQAWIAARFP